MTDSNSNSNSNSSVMIYRGNISAYTGQECTVFHGGRNISRIRFADGHETATFNGCLYPISAGVKVGR